MECESFEHHNWESTPESGRRQGNINIDSTNVHNSTMVCKNSSSDSRTILHTTKEKSADSSIRSFKAASVKENAVSSISFIRTRLNSFGLPTDTTNILYDSWRNSTKKQYGSYLNKWVQFCVKRQIDSFKASNSIVLQFLTELFQKGLGYSAINTARSALSSVLDCGKVNSIGNDPLICRFMKGVYNKRPTLPRYEVTWDVDVMLKFLCTLSPVNMLTLKNLTLKLTMILSLLTAQRTQTLHLMDINDCTVNNDELIIKVTKLIKTSKPGSHLSDIHLPAYNKDKSLCVVDIYNEYIKRTKSLRGQYTKLFIMTMKPHKPVSKNTISRWIKLTMKLAGLDTNLFKPHSVRSASTSSAKKAGISIDVIMKSAGWKKESTFRKFYDKPIVDNNTNKGLSKKLLDNYLSHDQ